MTQLCRKDGASLNQVCLLRCAWTVRFFAEAISLLEPLMPAEPKLDPVVWFAITTWRARLAISFPLWTVANSKCTG